MKTNKFNNLRDQEKWDAFWNKRVKLKGKWHCKHCGEVMKGEEPYRAEPFAGTSIHCDECDGMLTERTGGGQNDPFNWELRDKDFVPNDFEADKQLLLIKIEALRKDFDKFSTQVSPSNWRTLGTQVSNLRKMEHDVKDFKHISKDDLAIDWVRKELGLE